MFWTTTGGNGGGALKSLGTTGFNRQLYAISTSSSLNLPFNEM